MEENQVINKPKTNNTNDFNLKELVYSISKYRHVLFILLAIILMSMMFLSIVKYDVKLLGFHVESFNFTGIDAIISLFNLNNFLPFIYDGFATTADNGTYVMWYSIALVGIVLLILKSLISIVVRTIVSAKKKTPIIRQNFLSSLNIMILSVVLTVVSYFYISDMVGDAFNSTGLDFSAAFSTHTIWISVAALVMFVYTTLLRKYDTEIENYSNFVMLWYSLFYKFRSLILAFCTTVIAVSYLLLVLLNFDLLILELISIFSSGDVLASIVTVISIRGIIVLSALTSLLMLVNVIKYIISAFKQKTIYANFNIKLKTLVVLLIITIYPLAYYYITSSSNLSILSNSYLFILIGISLIIYLITFRSNDFVVVGLYESDANNNLSRNPKYPIKFLNDNLSYRKLINQHYRNVYENKKHRK